MSAVKRKTRKGSWLKPATAAGRILNRLDATQPRTIFLATFLFVCLVSFAVQWVLLPYVFPQWHAGHGLLVGLDSIQFHQIAVELADQIRTQGWSAWQLRPEAQAPAGIAAAFYALTIPEPWVLIPLNAALHALAALLLWKILFLISGKRWPATIASLPFILFPSAMQWYSQNLKDGWSIAGGLLVLYGWLSLLKPGKDSSLIASAGLIAAGALLSWIPRPYNLQLLAAASLPVLICLFWQARLRSPRAAKQKARQLTSSLAAAGLLAALVWLSQGTYSVAYNQLPSTSLPSNSVELTWRETEWLPDRVDQILESLAATRYRYTNDFPDALSNIDTGENFFDADDVLLYVPRATEIMLFAPFPDTWFDEGSLESSQLMRRVAAAETAFNYFCLLGLPLAAWLWRRVEFWMAVSFSYLLILPQVLVVANVGTLYRFRYGGLMTLTALGLLALLVYWDDRSAGRA
jgi:hypothetical protein